MSQKREREGGEFGEESSGLGSSRWLLAVLAPWPDELGGVVAPATGLAENVALGVGIELGRAREDPEVVVTAAAHERVGVVGTQEEDAVVGIEGAEEGDAKDAGVVGQLGLALGDLPLAVLAALVGDLDDAVVLQCVEGGTLGQVALEAVVEACHLVPLAQITVEVDGRYRGVVDRGGGVARKDGEEEGDGEQDDAHHTEQWPAALGIAVKLRR